jgi:hypothetical protein
MENHPTPPAETVLYRVTYVDSVIREAYVEARDENGAEELVEEEFSDGVHHHAIDAYHDDMQALPTEDRTRRSCFECGH